MTETRQQTCSIECNLPYHSGWMHSSPPCGISTIVNLNGVHENTVNINITQRGNNSLATHVRQKCVSNDAHTQFATSVLVVCDLETSSPREM